MSKKPPHKPVVAARKSTNGNGAHKPPALPAPPAGYTRVPVDPMWWTFDGELHGAMVDTVATERANGEPVNAIVIVTSAPASAIDNWGEGRELVAGDVVCVDSAALLRYAPMTCDPQSMIPVVVRSVLDRGRRRILLDIGEPIPRVNPRVVLAQSAAA